MDGIAYVLAGLLTLVFVFLATIAHELTHYITIYPIAENVRLKREGYTRFFVEYDIYDSEQHMKLADISGISPLILGLGAIIILWALGGLPEPGLATMHLYAFLLVYTVGGPADYARVFA
jgi:hypothetical protein